MDTQLPAPSGLRQLNLKKSFKLSARSLLTACSKEEFCKAFPRFSAAEQENLYMLFVKGEFESICQETQVGTILDTIEQHVDERSMDPLHSDKTNLGDVKSHLSRARESEIRYLKDRLRFAEEQMQVMRGRVQRLKEEGNKFPATLDAVEKFRSQLVNSREGS